MTRCCVAIIVAMALHWSASAQAAPVTPTRDDEVLERLPLVSSAEQRELRALREALTKDPQNLKLATQLARRYVEIGRAEADPRYFGYAESALAPWWKLDQPPLEVLVLRATLKQNRHDFTGALKDLEQALHRNPRSPQAWLTRAVILQVQGEYEQARASCLPLLRLGEGFLGAACLSSVTALNGRASEACADLDSALTQTQDVPIEERLWALTVLAECAARTGKRVEAERHFKVALSIASQDAYLLGAYADFLLDENRPAEVVVLLQEYTRVDGLLLRLALAERHLGQRTYTSHVETLRLRFEASRLRGDRLHQGEEARFTLHLLRQPEEALKLAQANWAVQKEPRDARVLLEAALAAGEKASARPVLEVLEKTGMEDVQLARLTAQFKENSL